MLVLTRKLEEGVMIGREIEVRVLGIHGDQVRLGFSAPRNIAVFRREVFEAIQEENRLAAGRDSSGMDTVAGLLRQDKSKAQHAQDG